MEDARLLKRQMLIKRELIFVKVITSKVKGFEESL
jgi:hypothetical protein